MTIYRVVRDANRFQGFLPADLTVWKTDLLKMDGRPKLPTWKPPEIYIRNPIQEKGNFFGLVTGGLVFDEPTADCLLDIFEMSGEVLPLTCNGARYYLLNILECINCLDQKNTVWETAVDGKKIRIEKFWFHGDRLSESTLFKIPELPLGSVLCVSGIKDPEDEFKHRVESVGLTGLRFEKLWSDSSDESVDESHP